MCREGDRDRRVDARQFLDDDRVRDRIRARAAVFLGNRHAHEAELGELRDEVVREALLAVEVGRDGGDATLREVAHCLAEELLLLGEVEVQAAMRDASSAISRTPKPLPPACHR